MNRRNKGPWTFKVRRMKNSGEKIVFIFSCLNGNKDELIATRWYSPWQNELMRENAKQIVDDLNAAFTKRNVAAVRGEEVKDASV